jgi:hypothetical protein
MNIIPELLLQNRAPHWPGTEKAQEQ